MSKNPITVDMAEWDKITVIAPDGTQLIIERTADDHDVHITVHGINIGRLGMSMRPLSGNSLVLRSER